MEGFVELSPGIDFAVECPKCGENVLAQDWKLTGLWTMANFRCKWCSLEFLFDLPYSLGVVIPCYLDIKKKSATPKYSGDWYAETTAAAWRQRKPNKTCISIERANYGTKVCLVNCLYPWWGDAVSLLLRVNQLKQVEGMDVIVLVNPSLVWLVPDYIGGIWVVDQDMQANSHWNESLDAEVKSIIKRLGLRVYLPTTFQPAYLTLEDIHAACKIEPFPRNEWNKRLQEKPTVTFISRTDRIWSNHLSRKLLSCMELLNARIKRVWPKAGRNFSQWLAGATQAAAIGKLAERIRKIFPKLEFAVCGLGKEGALPQWVKDFRVDVIEEDTNRAWAVQGARSHVVCGVTGSHLTLPGSLAGSYIELVPSNFLRNILTCASVTSREPREAIYSHRLLPLDTDPAYLADLIGAILLNFGYAAMAFKDAYYPPLNITSLSNVRHLLEDRRSALAMVSQDYLDRLAN